MQNLRRNNNRLRKQWKYAEEDRAFGVVKRIIFQTKSDAVDLPLKTATKVRHNSTQIK